MITVMMIVMMVLSYEDNVDDQEVEYDDNSDNDGDDIK